MNICGGAEGISGAGTVRCTDCKIHLQHNKLLCQGFRAERWRNDLSMNEAWTSEHQRRISLLVFHLQPLVGTVCRSGCEFCLAARSWCAWLGCGSAIQPCCQPDLGRTGCLQPGSICDRKLWEPLCAHKCLLCSSPLSWYLTDEVLQFFFSLEMTSYFLFIPDLLLVFLARKGNSEDVVF